MYVCAQRVYLVAMKKTECLRSPENEVTNVCEPPCKCWELNSSPLEEQPVLLTAKPSLQPLHIF